MTTTSTIVRRARLAAGVAGIAGITGMAAALPAAAQQPDRSQPPAVADAPAVALPAIQHFRLDNGMNVLLMQKTDLPLIQINIIIDAGTVRDDAGRTGVASMTAAMMDEGAGGRTALEIADAFEMLGARFGIGAGTHSASISLRTATDRIDEALAIAADVLLRPDFPVAELERLRAERLTALVRRYDDPGSIAAVLADATLFGTAHPYGRPAGGDEASLRAMTPADLSTFHERYYVPASATAILVGDIDGAQARRLLERAFGGWTADAEPVAAAVADPAQVRGRTIYLVDKPGAAQSVVRLGRIGVPRSTRDYYALEVMNVILGGSFTSRLNQNLREDKGYTYGASSGFGYMPGSGPWSASASIQTQSTGPALAEFMNELRGMREPIPADEVDRARNFLAMRYPAGFQSVAGIAARIGEMAQYSLPADYFNRYVDNVRAVTHADVERVAHEYIDPDNVAIFIVGDRAVIEQQVRDLQLGAIRLLDVTDVLGPVPVLGR